MLTQSNNTDSNKKLFERFSKDKPGRDGYLNAVSFRYKVTVLNSCRIYFSRQNKKAVDYIDYLFSNPSLIDDLQLPYVHSSTMTSSQVQFLTLEISRFIGEQK